MTYRTANHQSCILYIYSTNIGTEYFKHGVYSPFFPLRNAVCFIILMYLVPLLFTFYIQNVLKLKKNSGSKRLTNLMHKLLFYNKFIICLYMFRALSAHHQEVNLFYTASGIITLCRWPSSQPVYRKATYGVWWYQMLYNTILTCWWWAQ